MRKIFETNSFLIVSIIICIDVVKQSSMKLLDFLLAIITRAWRSRKKTKKTSARAITHAIHLITTVEPILVLLSWLYVPLKFNELFFIPQLLLENTSITTKQIKQKLV